jgi:predicted amidohydrolase
MKLLLINLAVNTQDNNFHRLGIDEKFELIKRCIHFFSHRIARIPDGAPFKAMLVAPEYFFARCCPETGGRGNRHYEYSDYIKIKEQLSLLSRQYSHILFIPGTVAYKLPILNAPLGSPVIDGSEYRPYAPIAYFENTENGRSDPYTTAQDHIRKAIDNLKTEFGNNVGASAKEHIQTGHKKACNLQNKLSNLLTIGIDPLHSFQEFCRTTKNFSFAKNTVFFYLNGAIVGEYTKHSDYQENIYMKLFHSNLIVNENAVAINGVESPVLSICGVRFGIEICLDHAYDVLRNYLVQDPSVIPDVHLILSATVQNNPTIPNIPIRIHSSITSALDEKGNTQLPIANRKELLAISTTDRLAVFESVPIDIPMPSAQPTYGKPKVLPMSRPFAFI